MSTEEETVETEEEEEGFDYGPDFNATIMETEGGMALALTGPDDEPLGHIHLPPSFLRTLVRVALEVMEQD